MLSVWVIEPKENFRRPKPLNKGNILYIIMKTPEKRGIPAQGNEKKMKPAYPGSSILVPHQEQKRGFTKKEIERLNEISSNRGTKSEILEKLRREYSINVKFAKGTRGALRLENKGHRIELESTINRIILREWFFYSDGGWKSNGYDKFTGITKEQDAIRSALQMFVRVDSDSYLVHFLEAKD